jgi:hypothetical protein
MADRTLRRPMFRRGGVANEGIMSGLQDQSGYVDESRLGLNSLVRPGYAEGDVVEPADTQEYRDYLEEEMYPSNIIGGTSRLFSNITDALYNYGARPLGNLAQYFVPIPGIEPIEKKDSVKENIERVMEMKGIDISDDKEKESEIIDLTKDVPEGADPGDGTTLGKNESGDMSESDLKTVYADLLPMFKETLGVDDREFTRDKYLELAKFGTSLMAQPGGSLVKAIGKAAEEPLIGLGKIAGEKRKAAQRPAELALSAALKESTPGSIGKAVRDLMKLGKTKAEAIKIATQREGSGIATKRLKYDVIKGLREDMQRDFGIKKGLGGASTKMYESEELGVMITDYEKLPEDKKDRKHGSYYVDADTGKIGRYNKPTGELIEPGDKGFTGKATK